MVDLIDVNLFLDSHHDDVVKILESETNKKRRWIKERMWLRKRGNKAMDQDEGG